MKKLEVLTLARAKNLSDDGTTNFFELVHHSFQENMFAVDDAANRIFKCDETGCSTDPNKKKLFFSKSGKRLIFVNSHLWQDHVYSPRLWLCCRRFLTTPCHTVLYTKAKECMTAGQMVVLLDAQLEILIVAG